MTEPDDLRKQWRAKMGNAPIQSCGRLDMRTWLPEPVRVGRVESDAIRYVYFEDGAEVVVLGDRADFVAFSAADHAALMAELSAKDEELGRLRKLVPPPADGRGS